MSNIAVFYVVRLRRGWPHDSVVYTRSLWRAVLQWEIRKAMLAPGGLS